MTQEEKIEQIKNFQLINDAFFEVFARDIPACQEILRVILVDAELTVMDVIVQSSERNLYGRSVRLDALCTLGNGTLCNIEVQRSDHDDHLRRARFNASSITVKDSDPGTHFKDVKEVYIVYISEADILSGGLTTYHIDKIIRENGLVVDDGLHEVFVNATVDDGSTIAELMKCFRQKELDNPKFPETTRRFNEIKKTEGGQRAMCEVMEEIVKEENIKHIADLLQAGVTKEQLSKTFPAEEIAEAEKELLIGV